MYLSAPAPIHMQGLISIAESAGAIVDAMDARTDTITFREQDR